MKRKLVSIIIVNWNGIRWLKNCFGSLALQNYRQYEIIFVDNASQDDSAAWVKMHYPKTIVLVNKKNLGFADANNVGYRKAKGKYVLFLNNDTRVTSTFLSRLVHVLESDPTIAGVQSKIILMDHPDTHDSVGAFLTPTGFLYHYGFGKRNVKKYNKQINLYTAKGACMLFRKDVLDRIAINHDIFDPAYFAYFEETDMCHRVWLAGYRIVYAYRSVIYHKMGATSSSMNNTFIQYHSFKNRIRTFIKNFGTLWLWTILPFHFFLSQLYAIILFVRGKVTLAWAIERAWWWNIRFLKQTLQTRRYIQQKIRLLPDSILQSNILYYPKLQYYISLATGSIESYEETRTF